jgi:hypothetical protein
MKKFYLPLMFILLSSSLIKSQDTIILKNAEIIVGKVITIGEKEISYKNFQNLSGPDYSLSLTKVAGIKYPNGYIDVFDESSLSLNFRNYYKSQKSKNNPSASGNKSVETSQDSLFINTLLTEHQAIQTKYDQLYQTNRVIIDNQISQDSIIQQNHIDHDLKLSEIQDNIQNQQQASEKKPRLS